MDGSEYTFNAKGGVVLATGGFGANAELVGRFAPRLGHLRSTNLPGTTGDLFAPLEDIGAAAVGMDFFQLKGAVERILAGLRITDVTFEAEHDNPSYHPGRCAKVYAGGKLLGVLGQIHPLAAANYGVDAELYTAELWLG